MNMNAMIAIDGRIWHVNAFHEKCSLCFLITFTTSLHINNKRKVQLLKILQEYLQLIEFIKINISKS
jgi:hypothetical protein